METFRSKLWAIRLGIKQCTDITQAQTSLGLLSSYHSGKALLAVKDLVLDMLSRPLTTFYVLFVICTMVLSSSNPFPNLIEDFLALYIDPKNPHPSLFDDFPFNAKGYLLQKTLDPRAAEKIF